MNKVVLKRTSIYRASSAVRHIFTVVLSCLLIVFLSMTCRAADKSGVTPNTISLPSGPGSIEGLGESFQPTLNTGTAKYRVGLTVPPGTAGHAPSLALQYDGGGSNGPLGFGWSMGIPFVQRQSDKGIPRYVDGNNEIDDDGDGQVDDPDEIDIFINEAREELVLTADGFYFCKNEGAFIRYRRVGDHWEGNLPDGTLMEFGLTESARIADPATGHVYRWILEKETDTNGNTIVYSYKSFPGDKNTNQRYLSKIEYGPGAPPWSNFHFIGFEYEDRSDWFEDARSGFIVRTGKRIKEIVVGTQGPTLAGHASGDFNGDGQTDYLNRKYRLAYDAHAHWSLLTSVAWVGADNDSTYPPLVLGYTVADPPDKVFASDEVIGSINTPMHVMDNDLVDLVDLNGDALPDILKTELDGGSHTGYLNRGETGDDGSKAIQWGAATEVSCADGLGLAWNFNLQNSTNAIAHLADMDGDGLADFVYKSLIGDVYYFRNQASLSWGPRLQMNIDPESAPPSPFGVENVKTADLNFDKRMDIIQSIDDGFRYKIWFNLGNQLFSKVTTVSQDFGFMLSATGVHIADFNGDRVPDIVRVRTKGLEVTAGLGYGRFAPMVFVPLPDYTLDVEQLGQVERARLQDITGDGLMDLVIERAPNKQLWYWINKGNYALDNRRDILEMPVPVGINPAIRWADLNGNGTTDLIYADRETNPRIQTVDIGKLIGAVPSPNMLVSIDNGIGRKVTIEYATSTKFLMEDASKGHIWPNPLPFPVNVVSKVTVDDSMGNKYVTEYTYHDGYYDGEEKEFRGFAAVEKRDIGDVTAPDLILAYQFDTGAGEEALKGKTLQVEARNAKDEIFYRERNAWKTRKLADSADGDGREVMFPFQEDKIRDVIEKGNGTPVQLKWEYEYDNYGNITRQFEHGRMDAGWDDERVTETSYTSNYSSGQTAWILREVVDQTVTDESGTKASHSRHYYDSNTALGEVSKGNLTRTEDWVSGDKYVVSVRSGYDTHGNITAIYDPLYGAEAGHYRELVYDSTFHSYPVKEIVHTGNDKLSELTFSASYDYGFSVVTASTDLNGFTTAYGYDAFARLKSVTKPPDTNHTVEYEYMLAHDLGEEKIINWVETRQRDGSEGDSFLHSRTFSDGLSREIMTRSEGETPGQIVVTGKVDFNERKGPWKEYLPYFDTGTLDYKKPSLENAFIEHFYDALGREVRVNQPEMSGNVFYSTTQYAPLSSTVMDENQTNPHSPHSGSSMRLVEDGLLGKEGTGRIREVYQDVKITDTGGPLNAPVEWLTRYDYDLLDNLIGFTDSQGNRRSFEYDGLSRNTNIDDPDRGLKTFFYDDASNVVKTVDAKGQQILFAYDGVNRLISEDYIDEGLPFSANLSPDISYFYDSPAGSIDLGDGTQGSASNTKGFSAWVRDLSGETHISYDERGRIIWVVKKVADPDTGLMVPYKTEWTYDSMDRVHTLIYADNDHLSYSYNARGLMEAINGGPGVTIISNLDYGPAGKLKVCNIGNNVTTLRQYDRRLRLSRLQTYSSLEPAIPLLDYDYTYDGASNIRRISDLRPEAVAPIGDPRRNSQIFTYDDLYRLTGVTYSFAAPGQADRNDGTIAYGYDRIGNMLSKISGIAHTENGSSVTNIGQMGYGGTAGRFNRLGRSSGDPPGPHALTHTDNGNDKRIIPYDDNGNMTTLEGKTFTWDFKDRLVAVDSETGQAKYIYDYTDRRIVKSVKYWDTDGEDTSIKRAMSKTIYVDQGFEVRDKQPVKYVYAGDKRIARVTGTLDSEQHRVQRLLLHSGWNLVAVAVATDSGLGDVTGVSCVYRWNTKTTTWAILNSSTPLKQGDILWLQVDGPKFINLKGAHVNSTTPQVFERSGYYTSGGLGSLVLHPIPMGSSVWFYDSDEGQWRVGFGGTLPSLSDGPKLLSAGQAMFFRSEGGTSNLIVDKAAEVLYYHDDHLGSSNLITNAKGELHAEETFYPFGAGRTGYRDTPPDTHYRFIGQERDDESGNYYLNARYYSAALGRFLGVDPLSQDSAASVGRPLATQAYAYSRSNPVIFVDPGGREEDIAEYTSEETATDSEIWGFVRGQWGKSAYWVPSTEGNVFVYARATPGDKAQKVAVLKGARKVGGAETLARWSANATTFIMTGGPEAVAGGIRGLVSVGKSLFQAGKGALSRRAAAQVVSGNSWWQSPAEYAKKLADAEKAWNQNAQINRLIGWANKLEDTLGAGGTSGLQMRGPGMRDIFGGAVRKTMNISDDLARKYDDIARYFQKELEVFAGGKYDVF